MRLSLRARKWALHSFSFFHRLFILSPTPLHVLKVGASLIGMDIGEEVICVCSFQLCIIIELRQFIKHALKGNNRTF